jgi:hypothetical protein
MSVPKEFNPQPDKAFSELQMEYNKIKHDTRVFTQGHRIPTPSEKALAEHYKTTDEMVLSFDNWLKANNLVKLPGMLEAFLAGHKVSDSQPIAEEDRKAIIYNYLGVKTTGIKITPQNWNS